VDSDWGDFLAEEKSSSEAMVSLTIATRIIDMLLSSAGPADLCRQIVHADFTPESTRGCCLFYLDSKSSLRQIASYGNNPPVESGLSAWDDSVLSEAVREKRVTQGLVKDQGSKVLVVSLPLIANAVPVGLLTLTLGNDQKELEIVPSEVNIYSRLGAFYLESLDFGNVSSGSGPVSVNPEDLTTRQLTILGHIEAGLVNLEIAKLLMLSESTIRQETVRIYRALGVGNRQEAVKKARALGVLAKKGVPVSA
jgi:DNA-binding CsgD family transcriptional regulator